MLENDTSAPAVGKRLRYVRKLADLSREELALEAGVSATSISYWEHANEDSSKMTLKSMTKVLQALKKRVECTERWLRAGIGPGPRLITDNMNIQLANDRATIDKTFLSALLIANLSEEIKRFTSISEQAVIAKVDTNCMYPALKPGDIVGGIWQPGSTLKTENICIIEINGKIQIRRVMPTSKSGIFHIAFLAYDSTQTEPFDLKDIALEKAAPIIRVWR